jgi:two-component system sensor kinase FixL
MEYRLRRADGEYRWLLDNGVPRYTPQGAFAGYIGSCVDITERKRAEEQRCQAELEVRRLQHELFHVTRVSLMGALTSALAHELNQPLTAILTNAQAAQRLLASGEAGLNEIHEILADIVADNQRAGEVIQRLYRFLKKGELEFQPLDLNELIRGVEQLLRNEALARDTGVILELQADLPKVPGDRVELQQVILNLMMNALDAMGQSAGPERKFTVRSRRADAQSVCVAVQDSGPGIPSNLATRLFEPFVTTKAEGMGMGLSICRAIIEAHQGCIRAFNNSGPGATFEVVLPVATNLNREPRALAGAVLPRTGPLGVSPH